VLLLLVVAFASVLTSLLPVSDASGGAVPAEFPGNIMEAHGEGRLPGRVSHVASEDSQSGKQ